MRYNGCKIFQNAYRGKAYIGMRVYEPRFSHSDEYIQVKLKKRLKQNVIYYASFHINLRNCSQWSVSDFGGHFSIDRPIDTNNLRYLTLAPQINNPNVKFLDDTLNWTKISDIYTASGNEKWFTIGRFVASENDYRKNIRKLDLPREEAYYFLDYVVVIPISEPTMHDTIYLCEGATYTLDAGEYSESTMWNTGSTERYLSIKEPGIYSTESYYEGVKFEQKFIVIGKPAPYREFTDVRWICDSASVELKIQTDAKKIEWSTGDTTYNIHVNYSGKYWVKTFFDCGIKTDTIYVKPQLKSLNIGNDTVICGNEPIKISSNIFEASYNWSTGENTREISTNINGMYSLIVNVCGETFFDSIYIETNPSLFDVLTPNVFTPNNDKLNDDFLSINHSDSSYSLQIYNRWGQQVYQSTLNGWNGKIKGDLAPEGIYFYVLSYTACNKKKVYANGTVLLSRQSE